VFPTESGRRKIGLGGWRLVFHFIALGDPWGIKGSYPGLVKCFQYGGAKGEREVPLLRVRHLSFSFRLRQTKRKEVWAGPRCYRGGRNFWNGL